MEIVLQKTLEKLLANNNLVLDGLKTFHKTKTWEKEGILLFVSR
jgi:hypothetical protein